jgi:hypothetical protein
MKPEFVNDGPEFANAGSRIKPDADYAATEKALKACQDADELSRQSVPDDLRDAHQNASNLLHEAATQAHAKGDHLHAKWLEKKRDEHAQQAVDFASKTEPHDEERRS